MEKAPMNKLLNRLYAATGVAGIGSLLAVSVAQGLIDRALHPVDSYRDLQERRAVDRVRAQSSLPE
ncbi:hypothetical protein [Mycobacterium alsense]|uniref:hypothetical protein n=1 Tax=Mycobacterium alsense TaxID=324058 RepID=UPI00104226A9|nr:hypothetical protein [Mycobacterium alsense]